MNIRPPNARPATSPRALLAAAAMFSGSSLALAQAPGAEPAIPGVVDPSGRRPQSTEPTKIAFKNVPLDQIIPFIVECTGKVVMPQQDVLARRITIINDQPIDRSKALNLVFLALQQAGIGVVETEDLVILRDIAEITRQDVPVLGPDVSTLDRTDPGSVVEKVFALRYASAENLGKILKDSLPDFAKFYVDTESNQVVVMGNIALLQRLERIVLSLDRPSAASLSTETFILKYADATHIAENIRELYSTDAGRTATGNRQNTQQSPFQQFFRQQGGGGQGGRGGPGAQAGRNAGGAANQPARAGGADDTSPSANLRVTANTQQNSVTVLAEPIVLSQIRRQILDVWDKPLPEEAVVPRIYNLVNSDPVKVRDLLEGLFGGGTSGSTGAASSTTGQSSRLGGQFSFQAIPEAGRLVVISKSPDNLSVIDKIIEDLDKPLSIGLPKVIELKHANAEELAEQLNALLAQEGTLAQIRRSASGLTTGGAAGASPFAADPSTGSTANNQQQNQGATTSETITFWWQRARPPSDNAGSSALVSKIRIVPVWRQNAVMIMAPPEYQAALVQLAQTLDQPGRQVLLSAIIAEVALDDATALGLRVSSQAITPGDGENTIGGSIGSENVANNVFPGLFDTSVLNVNVSANLLLQALNTKTTVNVLSEPRIWTSDNQEAAFFDGQDIPFITDTQSTDTGLIQSFDYRAVGLQLRIRPRITVNHDVDVRIDVELSRIQPNQTLFGGFIVDRRQTTTQLIVQNNQTIVLSGIIRSEDSDVVRKVPLLGDLPLIGPLFQSIDKQKSKTELLVFVTPLVIDNPTTSYDANVPYRQRLDQLRNTLKPDEIAPPGEEPLPPLPNDNPNTPTAPPPPPPAEGRQ
ncbi:MAG: hypothetical protein KF745_04940 [Phycisphaeraceae bacterium]|nr:hypothetical protein [Phycisphaeraceae bacterium]